MANYLLSAGIILFFIAVAFIVIGSLAGAERNNTEIAFGGFVGFIPFGFATNKRMLLFVMILTVAFAVFFVLIRFIWR